MSVLVGIVFVVLLLTLWGGVGVFSASIFLCALDASCPPESVAVDFAKCVLFFLLAFGLTWLFVSVDE